MIANNDQLRNKITILNCKIKVKNMFFIICFRYFTSLKVYSCVIFAYILILKKKKIS